MTAPDAIAAGEITGLVLAGGRGSRMGGIDKGLQNFNGTPLALHALMRLSPQVGELMINANRNLAAYESFGVPVWPDGLADYAGPLAGFLTGLERCETPYLLTVPCDTPLFPLDLAQRLGEALLAQDAEIAMVNAPEAAAEADGASALRPQPVFCLLRATLLAGGRPQDRPLDRPAPHRAGTLRPPRRCARRLLQRQHAGRAARARRPATLTLLPS
jgi:molybdopterin-guanine dinucleotide biosynthesis protein A